jgi:hypothetical protein
MNVWTIARCCLLRLGQISKIISRDAKTPVNLPASDIPVPAVSVNVDSSDCFSVCPPPYPFGFELVLRRPLLPKNSDHKNEGVTLRELIQRGRMIPSMRAGTPMTRPGSTGASLVGSTAQVCTYLLTSLFKTPCNSMQLSLGSCPCGNVHVQPFIGYDRKH